MLRWLLFSVLTLVLTVVHVAYNHKFSYLLFKLEGGVTAEAKWTTYGGIDRTWENPVYLPGGVCMAIGGGPIALFLLLTGSFVAGGSLASLLWAIAAWEKPILGKYYWRLLMLFLSWGWVLVPVQYTWVYFWTVKY